MPQFPRGSGLIFMKIGSHAREPLEQIIPRKRKELDQAGRIFWGYGGNTCHPLNFVRPFAVSHANDGRTIHLVMQKMGSRHFAEPDLAREYSDDGVVWQPIPRGIEVRGSHYAMVLGSLEEEEFLLNLNAIQVARGQKQGTLAAEYLRGRVDKGCFEVVEDAISSADETGTLAGHQASICFSGQIIEPYAVFLR
jgi:hypothetical protein